MNNILSIVNKRSVPGVLIVDSDYRLLYANREALGIIPALRQSTPDEAESSPYLPDEIVSLCNILRMCDTTVAAVHGKMSSCQILAEAGARCSLRAFFIDYAKDSEEGQHIMVLVEQVIERHEIDFEKAQRDYMLTKREVEILQCICRGLTNREIAESKFISEYTVKDHIKKIMRNMRVNSRSEILAALR